MQDASKRHQLQKTLGQLIAFLGQTYEATSAEVARAEYAVQLSGRMLQDLQNRLAASTPSEALLPDPSLAQAVQEAAEPSAKDAEVYQESAPPTDDVAKLQNERLQAVLAKARAIRGQSSSQPSAAKPWVPTAAAKPLHAARHAAQPQNTTAMSNRGRTKTLQQPSKSAVHRQNVPRQPVKSEAAHGRVQQQQQQQQIESKPHSTRMQQEERQATGAAVSQPVQAPLQLPASFRRALAAFRDPPSVQQDQHGTAANISQQSGSNPAYTNLDFVHQETLGAIGQAGSAFQAMFGSDNATEQGADLDAQWAAPEKQRWLRYSALVEAQMLLIQRLTARLQQDKADADACHMQHDDASWQQTLHLWQEVQQEYHVLFESNIGDPEAVARWRNRALRFVLPSDGQASDGPDHLTHLRPVQGVTKPAGAWLPEACWEPLDSQAAQPAEEGIQNRPGSILLPGGVAGTDGGVRTVEYGSLAELQKLSRLQQQLQSYLWQQHLESTVGAPLMPLPDTHDSLAESEAHNVIPHIRLAHAFLCKGAEHGLCSIALEHMG